MPSRYSCDEDDDAAESQALILQRLQTGPTSYSAGPSRYLTPNTATTTTPGPNHPPLPPRVLYSDEEYEDDYQTGDVEEQTDELLEKRRQRALSRQLQLQQANDPVNNAGRPPWLVTLVQNTRQLSLVKKLALAALALLLLSALFFLALGPVSTDQDGKTHHRIPTWKWGGNYWKGGKMPYDFPADVGYPGPTQKGPPAQLAQEDNVAYSGQLKKPWNSLPIEITLPEAQGKYRDFEPFLHMGPLTPYASSTGFGIDTGKHRRLPQGCEIEQVHYLSRHGSRYPTSGSPANLIRDLLNQSPRPTFSGPLSFFNSYKYRLGKELLVPLGRQQLYDEGVSAVISYGNLIYSDIASFGTIFARAGSQHRIVESARNWLAGALGVGGQWEKTSTLEIQIEAAGFNTTLAPNFACPNAGKLGWEIGNGWKEQWISDYARLAADRLQPYAHGVTLTPKLINALQQLCSYDTVAGFDATSLCSLFTKEEWLGYEYAWDLEFYGGYGSGSPVGAAQGIGYVNELLARLTGQPWDPKVQTSENSTFDIHPRTFPVNRKFYADFTHDSVIANVLAAIDLPEFTRELPVHRPDPSRHYRTSQLVPFGARLVVEKLHCQRSGSSDSTRGSRGRGRDTGGSVLEGQVEQAQENRYIRMMLNDAILPLGSLQGCAAEKRDDGICSMQRFIQSFEGRMDRVKWSRCFEA